MFTFKKEKPFTGLMAVDNPDPSTNIKHDKKVVGTITAPNWHSPDNKWAVRFMVKEGTSFKWVSLKARFYSEAAARKFIKNNAARLLDHLNLYYMDEE